MNDEAKARTIIREELDDLKRELGTLQRDALKLKTKIDSAMAKIYKLEAINEGFE